MLYIMCKIYGNKQKGSKIKYLFKVILYLKYSVSFCTPFSYFNMSDDKINKRNFIAKI